MAKKSLTQSSAPDHLTMRLFAPGMTTLHRAGLGGLACTLRYMEQAYEIGALSEAGIPGGLWQDGQPPWELREDEVTLSFGQADAAREFLKRLFLIAFQIKDGLVYLPGQYAALPPSLAVRAELQNGLTLSFLQHGKTRKLTKDSIPYQHDPNGDGSLVTVEYRRCEWYKHQDGWQDLTDERTGCLSNTALEVIGPLNPGAVVRHVAFSAATKIEDQPAYALPLYFALVGCLALPVNRGVGVLLVPEVDNLQTFVSDRQAMTPTSARECRIAGAGDAVLQTLVRIRSRGLIEAGFLPGCYGIRFQPTSWASQQKSRVETVFTEHPAVVHYQMEMDTADSRRLEQFEIALAELPSKVHTRMTSSVEGKGKRRQVVSKSESFWVDSAVRPLIADNLARGIRWYDRFYLLLRDKSGANKIVHERKGLQTMAEHPALTEDDEMRFIRTLHRAIYMARGKIYADTLGVAAAREKRPANQAVKNRWNNFMERLRLDLVGSKTATQVQNTVNELLVKAGTNSELLNDETLYLVKNLVFHPDWQRVRNLALFALASYKRPRTLAALPGEEETNSDNP